MDEPTWIIGNGPQATDSTFCVGLAPANRIAGSGGRAEAAHSGRRKHPNWIEMIKLWGSGECAPSILGIVQEIVLILKASQSLKLIHGWAPIFNLTSTICLCPVLATLASKIVTLATQAALQG